MDDRFLCVLEESSMDPPETDPSTAPLCRPSFEHESSEDTMVDYARELAFLSNFTELTQTNLDYDGKNVASSAHDEEQQGILFEVFDKHEQIMILRGNA